MKLIKPFAFLIILILLQSCCSKPYGTPRVDPEESEFTGIHNSLESSPEKAATLIMIHGMCYHNKVWVRKNAIRFGAILGLPDITVSTIDQDPDSVVKVHAFDLTDKDRLVRLYGIVYSDANEELKKKHLGYDSHGNCTQESQKNDPNSNTPCKRIRAKLNNKIKVGLLNDCFADAVIYLGKKNQTIKSGVEQSLIDISENRSSSPKLSKSSVFVISESLGSKVLKDVIVEKEPEIVKKIKPTLGNITHIFLGANQIPLLNLGEKEEQKTARSKFLDIIEWARQSVQEEKGLDKSMLFPLKVISFTDPNDLLSYEVGPEDYGNHDITNIIVSNDCTYFNYIENPETAHEGYRDNKQVIKLIACGRNKSGMSLCE